MTSGRGAVHRWSHGRRTVFLRPGEVMFAEKPAHVITVLGSCVAVVMYSPRLRVGGMCHAVLPWALSAGDDAGHPQFVEGAVDRLLDGLRFLGALTSELVIKAFGGAEGLSGPPGGRPGVGGRNVEVLRGILVRRGVRLSASDLGGNAGRKLHFLSDTGVVYLKRLESRPHAPVHPEAP
ncbi:MAG: chemotaxis protein CheD [Deferrisomatales bacterium]|nr:chemotaxis protein CheD [Deferrisomatales bacterium]